jgi:hypothetical protein
LGRQENIEEIIIRSEKDEKESTPMGIFGPQYNYYDSMVTHFAYPLAKY